jgi:hypothetical protein
MKSTVRLPLLLVFSLSLSLLPLPAGAARDHIRYYKTGLDAAEALNWQQVDTLMRRAIAEDPEESKRGLRSDYFPHYYLGLARYYLGDCPGALDSWEESENQGVIIGSQEHRELLRLQDDCRNNGTPTIASGSPEATAVSGKNRSGKEKVRTGQRWFDKVKDPARRTLDTLSRVAPEDSDLGKVARTARDVIEVADAATELVDVALPPKKKLEAAVNAYFAGNPRRALAFLEATELGDPRTRAQVYLFQSAANFRLHALVGGDEPRLSTARKYGDLFLKEQWRNDFPAELFDPRFVRFLQGGE